MTKCSHKDNKQSICAEQSSEQCNARPLDDVAGSADSTPSARHQLCAIRETLLSLNLRPST